MRVGEHKRGWEPRRHRRVHAAPPVRGQGRDHHLVDRGDRMSSNWQLFGVGVIGFVAGVIAACVGFYLLHNRKVLP